MLNPYTLGSCVGVCCSCAVEGDIASSCSSFSQRRCGWCRCCYCNCSACVGTGPNAISSCMFSLPAVAISRVFQGVHGIARDALMEMQLVDWHTRSPSCTNFRGTSGGGDVRFVSCCLRFRLYSLSVCLTAHDNIALCQGSPNSHFSLTVIVARAVPRSDEISVRNKSPRCWWTGAPFLSRRASNNTTITGFHLPTTPQSLIFRQFVISSHACHGSRRTGTLVLFCRLMW